MIKKIFLLLQAPKEWRLAAFIISGALVGLVAYLFYSSNAISYLSEDPKTCVNCHIMTPQYDTWFHSSHREHATCNDCHVPHNNIVNKYFFKAKDGARHSTIFTLRREPQVIYIKDAGLKVVQENCKRCHEAVNSEVGLLKLTGEKYLHGEDKVCWSCHQEVPHGRVNSLSSAPYARVPLPSSIVPKWMSSSNKSNLKDKNE